MKRRDLLYVDDENDNVVVFEAAFEDDFRVWTAESAQEALAILEEHPIPVVVSDQRMPEMTGVELFSIMRRRYPHIQRIILTGYTDPENNNAYTYYRSVLAQDPANGEAREGLDRIAIVLQERMQASLDAQRFDEAGRTLAQLRASSSLTNSTIFSRGCGSIA